MMSRREERVLQAIEWTRGPLTWSMRLARNPGPFRRLRRMPLALLRRVAEIQTFFILKS